MKKIHLTIIVFLLAAFLTGCGFRPRNAADIPPQLHHIFLNTENPYSTFSTELKAMLNSLHIRLAKSRFDAPYIIKINHYKFTQSNSAITTTSLAVTFVYTTSLSISIVNSAGKTIVGPKNMHASRSLVQNASQVYTPGTATLTKQELRRDLISQIYYFLVSEDTKAVLSHHHAALNKQRHSTALNKERHSTA